MVISKQADKVLQAMQPKRKAAIIEKVKAYARGERVDIKKLQGEDLYRIRVGQDRVIIDDQGQIVLARIAAGEETWPLEIVEARANGENSIAVFRKYRGLTVSDLAASAGISQPYLSEIEGGKKTGSVAVLKRIATALNVDLDDLVMERDAHQ